MRTRIGHVAWQVGNQNIFINVGHLKIEQKKLKERERQEQEQEQEEAE